MISKDNILGTKEVAELLRISVPALSNWRKRYADFPDPLVTLTATPIYDKQQIEAWMKKHGRDYHCSQVIPSYGKYKTIAITGRPRVGKSFLISLFAENIYAYRSACSRSGDDFTQCAVQNIIRDDIIEPHAVFHISKDKQNRDEHDYSDIDGLESPLEEDRFTSFMQEITQYLKTKKLEGDDLQDRAYIEIFMCPSDLAQNIMRKQNLNTLIITDTPGVSENYKLTPIEKANLVMIVISDSGKLEAQKSYKELVRGLAPLVATSQVCFLYNIKTFCEDREEFDEMQKEARLAMESFSDCFEDLQGRIVDSSMDILQPEKTVIGIPGMKPKKICLAEKMFVQILEEKILKVFSNTGISYDDVKQSIESAGATKDDVINFMQSILSPWSQTRLKSIQTGEGYFLQFVNEKHDRVKSADGYRLLHQANLQCRALLYNLYKELSQYTTKDFVEQWKQILLKFLYAQLTNGVKEDVGIARGTHPWEDTPPITMYVIESILAKPIREALLAEMKNGSRNYLAKYIETMKKYNIASNSWGYVDIDLFDRKGLTKFDVIINSGLYSIKTNSLSDLVYCRYTLGLMKTTEYKIFEKVLISFGEDAKEASSKAFDMI